MILPHACPLQLALQGPMLWMPGRLASRVLMHGTFDHTLIPAYASARKAALLLSQVRERERGTRKSTVGWKDWL